VRKKKKNLIQEYIPMTLANQGSDEVRFLFFFFDRTNQFQALLIITRDESNE